MRAHRQATTGKKGLLPGRHRKNRYTDTISFAVMERRGISYAFTYSRHF